MQFGPGAMQQHGFARNLEWEIGSTSADLQPDERDPEVELVLTDNDYTRGMWCAVPQPASVADSDSDAYFLYQMIVGSQDAGSSLVESSMCVS